jgi:hypothetical protein
MAQAVGRVIPREPGWGTERVTPSVDRPHSDPQRKYMVSVRDRDLTPLRTFVPSEA